MYIYPLYCAVIVVFSCLCIAGKKNSAECSSVDPVFSRKRRRVSKIGIDGGGEIVPSSSPSSSSSDYEAGVSNQDGLEILGTVDVGAGTSREGSSSGSNNTPPRPLSAIQPTVESELKAVPELPVTAEKKAKRARTSFTRTQLQVLEFYFLTCPYPDTTARSQIAKTANIDENTVQVGTAVVAIMVYSVNLIPFLPSPSPSPSFPSLVLSLFPPLSLSPGVVPKQTCSLPQKRAATSAITATINAHDCRAYGCSPQLHYACHSKPRTLQPLLPGLYAIPSLPDAIPVSYGLLSTHIPPTDGAETTRAGESG